MRRPCKALLEQVDDLKKVRRSTLTGPQRRCLRLTVWLFQISKSFVITSKGSCWPWTTNWEPLQHKPNLVVNAPLLIAWSRKWALGIRWHWCLGVASDHGNHPSPTKIHQTLSQSPMNDPHMFAWTTWTTSYCNNVTICIQWRGMDLQLETGTSDCRHRLGVIGIFGLDDLAANSCHAHDVNNILE